MPLAYGPFRHAVLIHVSSSDESEDPAMGKSSDTILNRRALLDTPAGAIANSAFAASKPPSWQGPRLDYDA